MLGGVVFDLDGTLGDTLPVCFAAFRAVFRRHLGVTYTDDQIMDMFGPTEEGILATRIPSAVGDPMTDYLAAYVEAHDLAPDPFPGIRQILDRLDERSTPAAVVTGKGLRSTVVTLERWEILERFERVEAGSDHGNIKVENMRKVVAEWGAEPASVVSVGDVASDITAARQAGLVAAAAAWASTTDVGALAAASPDVLFERVEDFAGWLVTR